jgi:hypothetical protein
MGHVNLGKYFKFSKHEELAFHLALGSIPSARQGCEIRIGNLLSEKHWFDD